MAVVEYHALHARRPSEPLLPLCLAACKLQESLSRKSKSATRGHAALVAASWLSIYAQTRSATHPQERRQLCSAAALPCCVDGVGD